MDAPLFLVRWAAVRLSALNCSYEYSVPLGETTDHTTIKTQQSIWSSLQLRWKYVVRKLLVLDCDNIYRYSTILFNEPDEHYWFKEMSNPHHKLKEMSNPHHKLKEMSNPHHNINHLIPQILWYSCSLRNPPTEPPLYRRNHYKGNFIPYAIHTFQWFLIKINQVIIMYVSIHYSCIFQFLQSYLGGSK